MVNKTAGCFNNILFWSWKLVEKIYWKNGKQLNVGKDLLSVAVSRSNFLFQSGFSQKDDEEKFDHHSEKFAEKKTFAYCPIFVLFVLSLLIFELSNINWKCSEHICMLTEHTYDCAVLYLKFFNEILFSIMAFIEIYAIKVSVWTRYKAFPKKKGI